jgi:hypothetical protein
LGSGWLSPLGRLTVRKAQILSGNRMAQEANAGRRKATGNRENQAGPPTSAAG